MSQSPFVGESFPKVYSIYCRSHGQRSKCIHTSPLGHQFVSAACPSRLACRVEWAGGVPKPQADWKLMSTDAIRRLHSEPGLLVKSGCLRQLTFQYSSSLAFHTFHDFL